MSIEGRASLMRIYTDERAKGDSGPLYNVVREAKLAGATAA